jgi:hypothetical protein
MPRKIRFGVRSVDIADLTPIETRVRDHDFKTADGGKTDDRMLRRFRYQSEQACMQCRLVVTDPVSIRELGDSTLGEKVVRSEKRSEQLELI